MNTPASRGAPAPRVRRATMPSWPGRSPAWLLAAGMLLAACRSNPTPKAPAPQSRDTFAPTAQFYEREADHKQQHWNRSYVRIEGQDVLLPPFGPNLARTDARTYDFFVFANHPSDTGVGIRDLLASGQLKVEVIGAKAELFFDVRSEKDGVSINDGVLRLEVKPSGDDGLRPFTILAWFPAEYAAERTEQARTRALRHPSAFMARRDVAVYYGDIRTRVQIVSDNEAQAAFGPEFARAFHVGRVFLRNQSRDHSLAVFTTSMRVPVLFHRRSTLESSVDPALIRRVENLAAERHARDHAEAIKKGEVLGAEAFGRDAARALVHELDPIDLALEQDKPATGRHARGRAAGSSRRSLSDSQVRVLEDRVLATWIWLESKVAPDTSGRLSSEARSILFEHALEEFREGTELNNTAALEKYKGLLSHPNREIEDKLRADASRLLESAARLIRRRVEEANALQAAQNQHAEALRGEITRQLSPATRIPSPEATLADIEQHTADLRAKAAQLPDAGTRAAVLARLSRYEQALRTARTEGAIATFLSTGTQTDRDLDQIVRTAVRALKFEVVADAPGAPFETAREQAVNPAGDPWAYSPSPGLQRVLLEDGYMWRDHYRPMTFQAVLNALMFEHNRGWRSTTVEAFETVARIAGGAIGLSNTIRELSKTSVTSSVNFFSTIIVPEVRGRLLTDLQTHIRNLGEMSMDTVVIIPPKESYDRYVFFPKGPIYNFPDEFDPISPAYIARVEGMELFVEAVPLDRGEIVRGGSVDATVLTGRALNEGRETTQSILLANAAAQARTRSAELANIIDQIHALLATVPPGEDGKPHVNRATVEHEIRGIVSRFTSYFGPDTSGALAHLLRSHGISGVDQPPFVDALARVELPAGLDSNPRPFVIKDDLHGLDQIQVEATLADDAAPLSAVEVRKDAQGVALVVKSAKAADENTSFPTRRVATLKITDPAGNVVTRELEVILNSPAITLATNDGRAIKESQEFPQALALVTASVALHDASADGLTLALAAQPAEGITIHEVPTTTVAGQRTLQATFRLDPSDLPAKAAGDDKPVAVTLTATLKRGDDEVSTHTVNVKIARPEPTP